MYEKPKAALWVVSISCTEVRMESVCTCSSAWLHQDEMEIKLASDNQRILEPRN